MKYIVLYILSFHFLISHAQIDSLTQLLPNIEGIEKAKVLNKLSLQLWNVDPDKGLKYAQDAYQISSENKNENYMASSLQNMGINYWAKTELHLALKHYQQSLEIYKNIHDLKGVSALCSNIGTVYKNLSDYENALKYYLEAIEIAENESFTEHYVRAIANISHVYLMQKKYDKALKSVQEAIDISITNNYNHNLSAYYNTQGQIFEAQENHEQAKSTYLKCLELNKEYGSNYGITISLYNIGNSEYNLGNYDSALDYFKESLTVSHKIDDKFGVLLANKSIGLILKEKRKFNAALHYYDEAYKLALNLDTREEKLELFSNYATLYKDQGNLKKSVYYLEQYIALKDSIYNESSSQQMAEMEAKYESGKKEKENEILRKNNEIQNLAIAKQTNLRNSFISLSLLVIFMIIILLSRYKIKKDANKQLFLDNTLIEKQKAELLVKNDELRKQYAHVELLNATKDKFFKIVAHDLKAPFNSILGFIGLLKSRFDVLDNSKRLEMINNIDQSSQHAYDLLINLLTWARSQTGEIKIKKEQLSLIDLVDRSVSLYGQSAANKSIKIEVNVSEDIQLKTDRDTTMIVIGNIINNAIKFTPENGSINIKATSEEHKVSLQISDSGVGMAPEVLNSLFRIDQSISTKGTNNEKGTGLGLILCKEFVERNGGSIDVKSELDKGSIFTITFPCLV